MNKNYTCNVLRPNSKPLETLQTRLIWKELIEEPKGIITIEKGFTQLKNPEEMELEKIVSALPLPFHVCMCFQVSVNSWLLPELVPTVFLARFFSEMVLLSPSKGPK